MEEHKMDWPTNHNEQRKWGFAYHEAGHAVACALYDFNITDEFYARGATVISSFGLGLRWDAIYVHLAGYAAERLLVKKLQELGHNTEWLEDEFQRWSRRTDNFDDDDYENAMDLAWEYVGNNADIFFRLSDSENDKEFRHTETQVYNAYDDASEKIERELSKLWVDVERIAMELHSKKRLTMSDVRGLLGTYQQIKQEQDDIIRKVEGNSLKTSKKRANTQKKQIKRKSKATR